MDPEEGGAGSVLDSLAVEVTSGGTNNETSDETDKDGGRLHERRAKDLAEDDDDKARETKTEVLPRTPVVGLRTGDTEDVGVVAARAGSTTRRG